MAELIGIWDPRAGNLVSVAAYFAPPILLPSFLQTHLRFRDRSLRYHAGIMRATAFERLMLPSGRIVDVPKATPSFSLWRGVQPADRYGKKPVLDFEGRMAFAELAILWGLQKAGWNGVWVDAYRRKFRADYWNAPAVELPQEPQALLDRISAVRGGKHRGTWDVFCWRDHEYLFAESKWKNHDRLNPAQLDWLDAALSLDVPLPSFLIVEWSLHAQQAWVS